MHRYHNEKDNSSPVINFGSERINNRNGNFPFSQNDTTKDPTGEMQRFLESARMGILFPSSMAKMQRRSYLQPGKF